MSWTTDPTQARWFAEVYWPRRSEGAGEIAVIGREVILTKSSLSSALAKGAVRSRDHPVSGAANETRTDSRPAQRQQEHVDAVPLCEVPASPNVRHTNTNASTRGSATIQSPSAAPARQPISVAS